MSGWRFVAFELRASSDSLPPLSFIPHPSPLRALMLRWRLLLGTLIIGLLVGLAWLDHGAALPGVWLMPVALVFCVLGSAELLRLMEAGGTRPIRWVVHLGNLVIVAANWAPYCGWGGRPARDAMANSIWLALRTPGDWALLMFGAGVLLAFLGEMARFRQPGGVTVNVAGAVFALAYIGVLLGFAIQLRLLWGIGSLASLLIVVKLGDTGAYTVGRLIGRHKMAPVLSPKKTVEGAVGAIAFGCLASWGTFRWLVPVSVPDSVAPGPWWGWIVYGILISLVGMLGDLAESLIKRDVQQKDSGQWLPGFGGVLDMLDSVLLAAPVAYLCWAVGVVGR